MIASIQRLFSLTLVAGLLGASALGILLDTPVLGAAFTLMVWFVYGTVLAIEFLSLWRSFGRNDPLRPTPLVLVRAWAMEALTSPRVFLWLQPFRSRSEPNHLPPGGRGRRGLLLIHGFFCNRGLWNPWMWRLRAVGVPFVAIDLEPILAPIESHRALIAAAVCDLEVSTGLAPVIVAHSMGGLAARAWIASEPSPARFHRLVTIGSPHAGTRVAGRGSAGNVRQMAVRNPWLERLKLSESASVRQRFVCFWSHCDNIVIPARSATLPDADNRHLAGTPHVRMVYHPRVIDEVMALVGAFPSTPEMAQR